MVISYSATAPQFSPEQEREERAKLTPEEREQIQKDIHGKTTILEEFQNDYEQEDETEQEEESSSSSSSSLSANNDNNNNDHDEELGIKLLHEAMDNLGILQKRAYFEACEKVPDLVQKESNPVTFLRGENWNHITAATRLAEYWKQRKSLFGPIKAFLPMTMKGALSSEEDLNTLHQGYMTILPPTTSGRSVAFFDGAQVVRCPRDSVLRVWFYMIHIVTSSESVQKHGYTIINNIKGFDVSKFDRILGKKSFAIVNDAMPARLRVSHACLGNAQKAIELVAPAAKQLAGRHIRLRSVVHVGSNNDMLSSMAKYGLETKHQSHVIGGGYTQNHFLEWLEAQQKNEECN